MAKQKGDPKDLSILSIVQKKDPSGVFSGFKDSQGQFRTRSLFWEHRHPNYKPFYTTKPYDHEGCISMYRKYMEIGDPTEYQVAIRLLGSWEHWQKLNGSKWFNELVTPWRKELKQKMESDRYWEMVQIKEDPNASDNAKLQATKWLAEHYSKKPKRGRPSKEEKDRLLKEETLEDQTTFKDAQRLGLVK